MRFQPKRRASIDHKPGPNIARAAPAVPSSSQTHLSPGSIMIFQISISATEVPTMGVHNPAIRRMPAPIASTAGMVTFKGGSIHSLEAARTTSAEPITKRRRSKPVPGQPPANVEYRRRNDASFSTELGFRVSEGTQNPKKRSNRHSLESCVCGVEAR